MPIISMRKKHLSSDVFLLVDSDDKIQLPRGTQCAISIFCNTVFLSHLFHFLSICHRSLVVFLQSPLSFYGWMSQEAVALTQGETETHMSDSE